MLQGCCSAGGSPVLINLIRNRICWYQPYILYLAVCARLVMHCMAWLIAVLLIILTPCKSS
jgi:hypothetical protein